MKPAVGDAAILRVSGVTHRFIAGGVREVSFDLLPCQVHALMGASGSGKTTLFRVIRGLEPPERGAVSIGGQRIDGLSRKQGAEMRFRMVGAVNQHHDLLPELNVVENVELPLMFDRSTARHARAHALDALDLVGIVDYAQRRPATLSGGELQRVSVARSLVATETVLVLADEPTASLDRESALTVFDALRRAAEVRNAGCLIATHDPFIAERCDVIHDISSAS